MKIHLVSFGKGNKGYLYNIYIYILYYIIIKFCGFSRGPGGLHV